MSTHLSPPVVGAIVLSVALLSFACGHKSAPPATAGLSSTPLAPPSASPAGSLNSVPAPYQQLYSQLERDVSSAAQKLSATSDGSTYPVNFAAELLTANANAGFTILQDGTRKTMLDELDADKAMGVQAVTVEVGFPLFDEPLYVSLGQSAAQAAQTIQRWLDYYKSVAQAARSRGLKLIVEANPLLTLATGSDSSLAVAPYYKSLDVPTYEARRAANDVLVAQTLQPDYLVVQSEPETDAINSQNPALASLMNTPAADVDMVRGIAAQLDAAHIAGLHTAIRLGAGTGTWQSDWRNYAIGFASIAALDLIDCHVYNLQPGLDEIGAATAIAEIAHAAGKGASMSEFWLHKSVSLSGFSGGDPLLDVRTRDTFSFWSPLDARMFRLIADLAKTKHFDYVSGFAFFQWFALVDYATLRPPCPPTFPATNATENSSCNSLIRAQLNSSAQAALASGSLSATGLAYRAAIGATR